MKATPQIINTKQLRATMAAVVASVRNGASFIVLHRARPAFQIVPPQSGPAIRLPLEDDPIYRAGALGKSRDGLSASEHDAVLYGK